MSYTYEYPRPALTVDAMIFSIETKPKKILLIKRKFPPFIDSWALPGGFVDIDETLEQAVFRELLEETALKMDKLAQFHTFGDIDRDPRHRTISVVYYGFASEENSKISAQDDAVEICWFDLDFLPELAFDHSNIIQMAKAKLFSDMN
ncbi:MAG: NUDIX hydrolase [Bacteroidetes bacterium]|jgi:8-oxo-dGTP diphosphatase|nr:NUDIX hydrolase [Bacteroidota bacterium]MBT6685449.1 NUDIX hydrolase [Bacteroidota bacterium]MBT7144798.1 NUDIX hydrolase [Bacteroidota bacterium]MBT7490554.1 NUDIX hydrolase [Bacteroidota bacterium]